MTLSQKIALEASEKEKFYLGELGFILTVIRDNTSDDYAYQVLDNIIKNATDFDE